MTELQGLSLALSIIAIAVSVFTFFISHRRKRKTEQLKLCINISSRLDYAKNKIFEIKEKLNSKTTTDQQIIEGWKTSLHVAFVSYLDQWEFFSFLVNTEEIHEAKILDYYKDRFYEDVDYCFKDDSGFTGSIESYKEIKKLLKEWHPNYYSSHFESK